MTVANPEQFNGALMEALGLNKDDYIVSVTITAEARKWPVVTIKRHVSGALAQEIIELLSHMQLEPKDDGK
jgi:hypothetical protein